MPRFEVGQPRFFVSVPCLTKTSQVSIGLPAGALVPVRRSRPIRACCREGRILSRLSFPSCSIPASPASRYERRGWHVFPRASPTWFDLVSAVSGFARLSMGSSCSPARAFSPMGSLRRPFFDLISNRRFSARRVRFCQVLQVL